MHRICWILNSTYIFTGQEIPAVSLPVNWWLMELFVMWWQPDPICFCCSCRNKKVLPPIAMEYFALNWSKWTNTEIVLLVMRKSIAVNDPGFEVQPNIATAENITVVSGFTTRRSRFDWVVQLGKVIDDRFNILKPDSSNFIYEKSAINVFPNPAKRQASISIRWNIPEPWSAGTYI